MMKIGQDNGMTAHTRAVYIENYIELSWPIGSCANYDKN